MCKSFRFFAVAILLSAVGCGNDLVVSSPTLSPMITAGRATTTTTIPQSSTTTTIPYVGLPPTTAPDWWVVGPTTTGELETAEDVVASVTTVDLLDIPDNGWRTILIDPLVVYASCYQLKMSYWVNVDYGENTHEVELAWIATQDFDTGAGTCIYDVDTIQVPKSPSGEYRVIIDFSNGNPEHVSYFEPDFENGVLKASLEKTYA